MTDVNIQNSSTTSTPPDGASSAEGSKDQIMQEIDAMFGQPGDGDDKPTKGKTQADGFKRTADGSIIDTTPQMAKDKFASKEGPKTVEEQLREFQSRYDKRDADYKKLEADYQSRKGAEDLLIQLKEDAEVRRAFIQELEPELIKPKDPYAFVKEGLAKEFGDDFTPMSDATPGTEEHIKSQLYQIRMNELFEESRKQGQVPEGFTQLMERRQKAQAEEAQKMEAAKAKLLQDMKWDDQAYSSFIGWAKALQPHHLAKIYQGAKTASRGTHVPSLANIPGGNNLSSDTANLKTELDSFFGK